MATDYTLLNRFLNSIESSTKGLKSSKVWYRGVKNSDYELTPALLRDKEMSKYEEQMFLKYMVISNSEMTNSRDHWKAVFDMQHYGVPTRLLDWTEVLGVALYFAVEGADKNQNSAIYILDPIELNSSIGREDVISDIDTIGYDYLELFDKRKTKTKSPIALEPPYQNPRIRSQRGKFTIHGLDNRPLEQQHPECIKKVIINKSTRKQIKNFLIYSGINSYSLFPDFEGMIPYLKEILLAKR